MTVTVTGTNAGTGSNVPAFTNMQNLTAAAAGRTCSRSRTRSIAGNVLGAAGADTLDFSARTTAVTFTVNAANGGTVTGVGGTFAAVENLTGGTAADTFAFGGTGSIAGNVVAGPGSDTLDYAAYGSAVTVTLAKDGTGTATGVGGTLAGLENAVGSALADTFNVQPLTAGNRSIDGNAPTASPGDVLNLDLTGATGVTLTANPPGRGRSRPRTPGR